MKSQWFNVGATTLSVCMLVVSAFAAEEARERFQDGKFVSLASGKLIMKTQGKSAKEVTQTVAPDATMMLDGKACSAEDLKAGTRIRVTTMMSDPKVATQIEAISKDKMFANTHAGTVVSISTSKLVMNDVDGKPHDHTVSADTQVCCDSDECKLSDLKPGMKIRVTTHKSNKAMAIVIQALDKDSEFAQQN